MFERLLRNCKILEVWNLDYDKEYEKGKFYFSLEMSKCSWVVHIW